MATQLDAADLEIAEVTPPEEPPKATFADRVKGFFDGAKTAEPVASSPRSRGSKAKREETQRNFVDQVVPLLALLVAALAEASIKDPYKPCAPSEVEATSILAPIMRIVSRQLDVRGKLNDNTVDALSALVAVSLYARRARADYLTIKAVADARSDSSSGDDPAQAQPPAQGLRLFNRREEQKPRGQDAPPANQRIRSSADQPVQPAGPDPISGLLAADREGRAKLGLD